MFDRVLNMPLRVYFYSLLIWGIILNLEVHIYRNGKLHFLFSDFSETYVYRYLQMYLGSYQTSGRYEGP